MDEPQYYRGTLEYPRGNDVEVVEFYYPADAKWSCINCGDCCGDIYQRTRMIKLLPKDIERIKETGATDFYELWGEGVFTGLMCKHDGKCVFYKDTGCSIYDHRALLCRMYPFWLEKQEEYFLFGIDHECQGYDKGKTLNEAFYAELLMIALRAMNY